MRKTTRMKQKITQTVTRVCYTRKRIAMITCGRTGTFHLNPTTQLTSPALTTLVTNTDITQWTSQIRNQTYRKIFNLTTNNVIVTARNKITQNSNNSSSMDELQITYQKTPISREHHHRSHRVSERELRDLGPILNQRKQEEPVTKYLRSS